jgi:GIY-YIG catalytic domain
MGDHVCQIYVLFNLDGEIDYVGRTARDIRKRLYEHKQKLGFMPQHEVIDRCSENCREVERRWIEHYRHLGAILRNISFGQGPHFAAESTRQKLREINTGRPVTWGAKISAAQKGRKKHWSAEGIERQKATHFQKGHANFDGFTAEQKEAHRERARRAWLDPEKRKRMTSKGGWATRRANAERRDA